MKKVLLVALMLSAGVAFASALGVPWFVDNAPAATGIPPATLNGGVMTLVYLHNNLLTDLTCTITYYTQTGVNIGPAAPDNTFVVPASSSVAFRPVRFDPDSVANGQESNVGMLIPDRPLGTAGGNDNKKHGSIGISWVGGTNDLQGMVTQILARNHPLDLTNPTGPKGRIVMQYGHLLPPGS